MPDHIVITGVPELGDFRPIAAVPRIDINDLVKKENIKQFSLYVLALTSLMKRDESDPLSWFQIAGIHGRPNTQWQDVPKNGYFCAHMEPYFPTWHRPYMALLEQTLQAEAVAIANKYKTPDKDEWIRAAKDLRLPYWDWADANAEYPPREVTQYETISILEPPLAKRTFSYPNPLKRYVFTSNLLFHPGDSTNRGDMKAFNKTFFKARSNDISKLLAAPPDWWRFATKRSHGGGTGGLGGASLESVHDQIHNTVGGFMPDLGIAAFDPIFWLHHVQVDRILDLWHRKNPLVPPQPATQDLTPFWKDQKNFWKDGNVLDTNTYNYSYPKPISRGANAPRTTPAEWNIFVTCNDHEAPGSFNIYFYLGNPPVDGESPYTDNLAGVYAAFVRSESERAECANCLANAENLVDGSVDITDHLENSGKDTGKVDVVVAYIRENLKWKIALAKDDTSFDLPSLQLKIHQVELLGFGDEGPDPSDDNPYTPYPRTGESIFHDLK